MEVVRRRTVPRKRLASIEPHSREPHHRLNSKAPLSELKISNGRSQSGRSLSESTGGQRRGGTGCGRTAKICAPLAQYSRESLSRSHSHSFSNVHRVHTLLSCVPVVEGGGGGGVDRGTSGDTPELHRCNIQPHLPYSYRTNHFTQSPKLIDYPWY